VTGQGARLTGRQRETLERDGYLVVPSLLDPTDLDRITGRVAELVSRTLEAWAADPDRAAAEQVEPGVVRARLRVDDHDFDACWEQPLLADAATTVLGHDWQRMALGLRAPLPGSGGQGLHADYAQRRPGERPWQALSAMWCISAFTPDNGPLRVIPGSHRVSEPPIDVAASGSGMGPYPAEVRIVAPAGSVILFNSADLWHSGTSNNSTAPRLAVTAGFRPGGPARDAG
jgi:ectoine hydroxylase-related dioxygenase (phytanoyl-CoA dioxygenase family)